MADIIQLLPDSVANQIAAGEVIQRPASVVKELIENAIDSGATKIIVNIKEAGRTFIQIIDNGCGMSETDARMAFERHATSKIKKADDLFAIRTMGFRGEALASVAAVAEVELKTRLHNEELGTHISIAASEVINQETVNCPEGSNFIVKNLFFNIPARRKFLKTDSTEIRHIINEFQKIAIPNPEIQFTLTHNNSIIYDLPSENIIKRIINLFGKSINQNLISINTHSNMVNVSGFIGKPEHAKKKSGEQFFFVNNRFMRHPYFHKAVLTAYENILSPDTYPTYIIFFEINPESIDINIHPTKTEIKFEEERSIWQILQATVKQSLGKFNITPSLDFNTDGVIDIPVLSKNQEIKSPEIKINPDYNPFKTDKKAAQKYSNKNIENWDTLYYGLESGESKKNEQNTTEEAVQKEIKLDKPDRSFDNNYNIYQLKSKYILTPVKSGLMIIDQKRAHERILYERYLKSLTHNFGIAQQDLFPQTIEINPADQALLSEIIEDLSKLGFDVREFGKNTYIINSYPADLVYNDPKEIIINFINEFKQTKDDIKLKVKDKLAISLAKASAINYGQKLNNEEMREIIDRLFACEYPNYSPTGKAVISILSIEDVDKRF